MTYQILFYEVVADYIEKRAPFRDEHLNLAWEYQRAGKLFMGGALAEPADGAVLIFRGDSPGDATAFAMNDPYVKNGLVRKWYIRPWTVVVE